MNFPAYCSVLLRLAAAFVISTVNAKLTLKDSKELSGPLTNLQIHKGLLYIGGKNKIYALDKNFEVKSSANMCDGTVQDCNNINKVLVVDPSENRLITCGTGNGGICEVRDLNDLANVTIQSSNNTDPYLVVSTDLDKPAVGMITSNEKFIIAVTFGNGIEKKDAGSGYKTYRYAISTRDTSKLNAEKKLNLEIHKDIDLENYIIYYKKSFQHAGFSYFVTNQKKKVDKSNSGYDSKFIRICQNDTDYHSYADVVITCESEYNFIQDAILVNSNDGNTILMGIFTKSQEPDKNSGDSVICGVNMEFLNDGIEKAKKNFFYNSTCSDRNDRVRYLPNKSIPQNKCPEGEFPRDLFHCPPKAVTFRYVTDSTSYNFELMFRLDAADGTLTSLSSTRINGESPVVLAGTSTGNVILMNFRGMSLTKYDMVSVESRSAIKPVRAIHQEDDDTLYVMATDRISKYASSDCSEFTTCQATMKGKNPLCGWCVFENRATRKSNCTAGLNRWLSSLTECIQLDLDPRGTPAAEGSTGDSKTVNILAANIPDHEPSFTYKCIFLNGSKSIGETEARRSGNSFTCNLPPVSSHTKAMLELVRTDQYVTLAQAPFLFFDCQTYIKCGECVNTTGAICSWSLGETKCKDSGGVIDNVSKCPRLADRRGLNFIPRNEQSEVVLHGIMINETLSAVPSFKFWCYVKSSDIPQAVGAVVVTGDIMACNLTIRSLASMKRNVTIVVKYSTASNFKESMAELDDEFRNTVTVYDCSQLAKNCSYCEALNSTRYTCNWCNTSCLYGNNCTGFCLAPTVTKIVPKDGHVDGGTKVTIFGKELGSNVSDIDSVTIGNIDCALSENLTEYLAYMNEDFDLRVPKQIVCTTGGGTAGNSGSVTVKVNGQKSGGNVVFTYKSVNVSGITPTQGPSSGGTRITIDGLNLGISSREWTVFLGSKQCTDAVVTPSIDLKADVSDVKFKIECVTGNYSGNVGGSISDMKLLIDGFTGIYTLNSPFLFLKDPEIGEISSKKGFLSGGIVLTVKGQDMANANKAVVSSTYDGKKMVENCKIQSPETTLCPVPSATEELKKDVMDRSKKESNRQKRDTCTGCIEVTIVVKLDGVKKDFVIRYFRDPTIYELGNKDVVLYGSDQQQLILSGEDLTLVATKDDFSVTIGVANCTVIKLTQDSLTCSPPNNQPAPNNTQHQFPEVNVNVGNIHVHVGYLQYEKKTELIAIIAGAAAGGLFFIVVIIFVIGLIKYRKVGKKAKAYEKNLSDMEMEIKRVAREEFLDMHTTMSTVNKNLVEQGFPYHTYQQFACNVMFSVDYLWTEPVVSNGKMTDDERLKANKGMESLESLIYNKFFLVSVITTMENEKRFFIREKSNLAGNLCAVLMGKMDYLNEILKLLMTNLVQESSAKKHKTLFRRCESITEKLLSNWVSLCLYPHVKSHSGSPLYLLYMATQKTMESGPIDAVTADAKYTLSEEKLLKKWSSTVEEDGDQDLKFEAKTLTLNVVVDNGDEIFKCKALDCDTISQVKAKCLNQIYVNYPASQLPVGANDLALEWHEGFGGALKLQDEDNTSKHDGHWVRLNTLAHYNVKDESNMALIDPHNTELNNQEDYVNLANINMDGVCDGSIDSSQPLTPHDEENPHEFEHWHLLKKEEESSKQGKSAIAELYLNRLFTTKQSLMEYMRPLFDIILDHDRCPPPTKFLYDFLDELGEKHKVEADTVHAWKSHSYAIRVWASLMKMPNTLFDVMIPPYMEENLSIISQVFIESFSIASQKFTKDSPSQKLIFHHEMNHYRERVKEFYKNVKVDSQNAEELRQYMTEVNRLQQQTNFNKVSALYRFYNQLKPYFEDILENLSKSKEASTLQLDRKLEQVIAIMEEED